VASDLPGYARVGRQGREALLVPPGDPDALGGALARVLTDGTLAACLVEGGRTRADELSMDHLADIYLDTYTRTIEASASTR
jgi:glycosyltransferase involved in cell wall biosynthesis